MYIYKRTCAGFENSVAVAVAVAVVVVVVAAAADLGAQLVLWGARLTEWFFGGLATCTLRVYMKSSYISMIQIINMFIN